MDDLVLLELLVGFLAHQLGRSSLMTAGHETEDMEEYVLLVLTGHAEAWLLS